MAQLIRRTAAAINPKNVTGIDKKASIPKPTQRPKLNSPYTKGLHAK
jgi:hypothetical protein